MTARELIEDVGYEDVIIYDNPSYDDAFIGVTNDNRAVYDYDKMVEWLVEKDGMTYDETADFISYNSSFYYGEGYPIIVNSLNFEEY